MIPPTRAALVLLLTTCLLLAAPKKRGRLPEIVEEPDGTLIHLFLKEDPQAQAWLCKPPLDLEEGEGKVDLIVALHGAGGNPKNFFHQRLLERRRAWGLAVAGRQAVSQGGRSGFMWDGSNVKYIADFVRYLVEKYPVRAERVLVWGHSAGGTMTLETLRHAPELFAGGLTTAAPMTPTSAHEDLRVVVFLGDRDANWAGAPTVRSFVEKQLKKRRKGACAFFAVQGLGHDVPAEEYLELGFDWILQGEARGGEATVGTSPEGSDGAYRHILVRYRGAEGAEGVRTSKGKAQKLLKEIRKQVEKDRAYFAFEACCHSEDDQTASCGGGIDEDALRGFLPDLPDLKPGEVSDILESPRGFHLVYRPGEETGSS